MLAAAEDGSYSRKAPTDHRFIQLVSMKNWKIPNMLNVVYFQSHQKIDQHLRCSSIPLAHQDDGNPPTERG